MTQPALAFQTSQPSAQGPPSIVDKALGSIFGGIAGGMGMSSSSSSGATSGDAAQGGSLLAGDMSVNFGDGVTQGGGLPWGKAALVVVGVAFIVKRFA